jgi:hypothetical protein
VLTVILLHFDQEPDLQRVVYIIMEQVELGQRLMLMLKALLNIY